MNQFLTDLLRIRKLTLEGLKALDGTVWREASGELHFQYKEMPNWITVDPDIDLRAAHQAFVAVFEPYFIALKDVNVTVSYTTAPETGGHQLAFFVTNDEVRTALNDPAFGANDVSK